MKHEFGFGESDGSTAASNYRWEHDGSAGDIIAYRVESWAGQKPANDNLTPRAQFDAASQLQEELAINISAQIANGVRPDAVQVLEWANALYEAEVGAA
ncbi:hypothetical protein [Bosea sp. FBZP-16]|uniref:hypothetical protein n=1 Tax=Bosea sp. FBZP-16 TaxID=2065382 RepID=UPI000C30E352|nr:hypothetical protein [Bosea sp. FBZP-16]